MGFSGKTAIMSLVVPEKFLHGLRVMNTNIDGGRKVPFAMTAIKGIGRRFAMIVCKKADIDITKRAGEMTDEEVEKLITIISNPRQYKIPDWFLNRQKDIVDGKFSQVMSNTLDNKLREDLERMKKIRAHRGLRHYWGLRVRGQHTKTTGRRGRTVGVSKRRVVKRFGARKHHDSTTFGEWDIRRDGWVLYFDEHIERIAFGNTRLGSTTMIKKAFQKQNLLCICEGVCCDMGGIYLR